MRTLLGCLLECTAHLPFTVCCGTPARKGGQEAIELELGVGMAGDDERDVEYIQHLIEHEVVTANLLGTYQPLIHYICTSSTPVCSPTMHH